LWPNDSAAGIAAKERHGLASMLKKRMRVREHGVCALLRGRDDSRCLRARLRVWPEGVEVVAAERYKIKITTTSGLIVYWVKRGCVHTLSRQLADI